jgi:hypothetical protein
MAYISIFNFDIAFCVDYRAMFTTGLNETMQDRIVMHEMEFSALRDIIHYFYTGEIEVRDCCFIE